MECDSCRSPEEDGHSAVAAQRGHVTARQRRAPSSISRSAVAFVSACGGGGVVSGCWWRSMPAVALSSCL